MGKGTGNGPPGPVGWHGSLPTDEATGAARPAPRPPRGPRARRAGTRHHGPSGRRGGDREDLAAAGVRRPGRRDHPRAARELRRPLDPAALGHSGTWPATPAAPSGRWQRGSRRLHRRAAGPDELSPASGRGGRRGRPLGRRRLPRHHPGLGQAGRAAAGDAGDQLPRPGAGRRAPAPAHHRRARRPGGAADGAGGAVGRGGGQAGNRGRARARSGGSGRWRQPLLPHRGPRCPRRDDPAVGAPRRDGPALAAALRVARPGAAGGDPTTPERGWSRRCWTIPRRWSRPNGARCWSPPRGAPGSATSWPPGVELSLPSARRTDHHAKVLAALVAAGAEPSRLVHHAVPPATRPRGPLRHSGGGRGGRGARRIARRPRSARLPWSEAPGWTS